ncbi:MAG: glycoside hydrolase [Pseudomonadota bacterium]
MLKKLSVFAFIFLMTTSLGWSKEIVELNGKAGEFTIDPATLAVSIIPINSSEKIDLTQRENRFDEVKNLKYHTKDARWDYPKLKIQAKVAIDDQGLRFLFTSSKEQNFEWPSAGLTQQATALIIPDGEGLYIPNRDPFWRKKFQQYPTLSLSMPFWAIQYGNHTISTLMANHDEDTDTQIKQKQGQLYIVNTHRFLKRDHFPTYEILLHSTGNSPISPALDYRYLLIEKNKFVSLKQKILENANVNKLLGAFHVWVWGDGKSINMLHEFDQLGIKHLWIGYDATPIPGGFTIDKTYVRTAENMGYLIAPYDSFDNAQNPKFSDSITSSWPNHVWPEACIHSLNGSILRGFGNRGCYLSAEALRLREAKEKNIARHIDAMVDKGDNSLFLDCDAANPLYEDYSKQHPMTRLQDLEDRIERMRYISSNKKLVLGSETGLAWSSPVIAYNNGGFLSFSQAFWPCLKDKKQFGAWWPTIRPAVLFKPYHAPSEFIHASYDPRYRLPLYEAVFHDAVVSTDRWELNELKIPALMQTKALLQNLYNIPPIWVLDQKTLKENENYFTAYYQFFSPLHQMAGLEALTQFTWLSKDHLLQQTQFGNRLILTANFSKQTHEGIAAGCIQAQWKEDGSKKVFCPKDNFDRK